MKHGLRLLLGIIGALATLVLLAVVAFLLMPAERLAQVAIDRLAEQTGREITITAAERPTLWPDVGILVEGLEVSNPIWAGSRPLLRAETAQIQVGWRALFGGGGRVDRLELRGADLTLVRGDDGQLSWRNGDASLLPLALERAEVEGGRLRFLDRAAGTTLDVRQLRATLDLDEDAGGSAAFAAAGVTRGTLMELSGTITRAAAFFDGEPQPIRLDLLWGDGSLRFNGRGALGGGAEGALEMRADDLEPVVRLVRSEVPDLVTRLAGREMSVNGTMSLAEGGSLHLRDGVIGIGETRLNAALDLVRGEDRPLLRGTITGGEIGLGEPLAMGQPAPDGEWSRERLDVSGLFDLDADLTVRADALQLGSLTLDGLDLRVALTRGRVVFDIARIGLAEGQLAGEFVINGRGGLSVGGELLLANAEAATLFEALTEAAPMTGSGSASIEFLGVGNDLYTIIDGLEAEGDLSLTRGVIEGFDLPGLARNEDEDALAEATTFDRLLADFRVRGGVVISEDLLLDGGWGGFDGAGEIDLAERSVGFRLSPRNFSERELPVPVLMNGPWDAIVVQPDAAALQARAEAAAAERARAAEVARLLGGPIEGDTPEDDPQAAEDVEAVEEADE